MIIHVGQLVLTSSDTMHCEWLRLRQDCHGADEQTCSLHDPDDEGSE